MPYQYDPIDLPEAVATEPPFLYFRVNEDWMGIIRGAVWEWLKRQYTFSDDGEPIKDTPRDLYNVIQALSEYVTFPMDNFFYIHPWLWQVIVGTAQKLYSSGAYNGGYIYNNSAGGNDVFEVPIRLPAGNYTIQATYWVGTVGGIATFRLDDHEGNKTGILTLTTYNATASYNNISNNIFTLSDDFEGWLNINITLDGAHPPNAKTLTLQETVIFEN